MASTLVKNLTGLPGLAAAVASGRHGRGWGFLTLGLTSLGIALTVALAVWYVQYRQPLSQVLGEVPVVGSLPGVKAATAPPPFQFAIYGLEAPRGVAISRDGNRIYATDTAVPRRVHVYDRTGNEVGTLAPPESMVKVWNPLYPAVGPDGTLYVSDAQNGAVQVFGADGNYRGALRPSGLGEEGWLPAALAVDGSGQLYVTDFLKGKHRVVILNADGSVKGQFGNEGLEPGQLSFPNGLALDGKGLIYVADSSNSRLQTLDPQTGSFGAVTTVQGLSLPRGLVIADNRLYIADTIGQSIFAYALENGEARLLYKISDEGMANGQIRYPEGLTVDGAGRIYVADRANNRIQVFGYR